MESGWDGCQCVCAQDPGVLTMRQDGAFLSPGTMPGRSHTCRRQGQKYCLAVRKEDTFVLSLLKYSSHRSPGRQVDPNSEHMILFKAIFLHV